MKKKHCLFKNFDHVFIVFFYEKMVLVFSVSQYDNVFAHI